MKTTKKTGKRVRAKFGKDGYQNGGPDMSGIETLSESERRKIGRALGKHREATTGKRGFLARLLD